MNRKQNSELFLRLFNDTGNFRARGFLSDAYKKIDDIELYPRVFSTVNWNDAKLISSYKDWEYSEALIIFQNVCNHENLELKAGISIQNGEIGNRAVGITPLIQIYNTSNGGINLIRHDQEGATRFIHRGNLSKEKLEEALTKAKSISELNIPITIGMTTNFIENPKEHLEEIVKESKHIPKRIMLSLNSEFIFQERVSELDFMIKLLDSVKHLGVFQKMLAEYEITSKIRSLKNSETKARKLIEVNM